ncbi:hypothetical protein PBRA_008530, partial [Plasmodiophora brassicae]
MCEMPRSPWHEGCEVVADSPQGSPSAHVQFFSSVFRSFFSGRCGALEKAVARSVHSLRTMAVMSLFPNVAEGHASPFAVIGKIHKG